MKIGITLNEVLRDFIGQLAYTYDKYVGENKDGKKHGQGIFTLANGRVFEGIWADDKFVRTEKVNLPAIQR